MGVSSVSPSARVQVIPSPIVSPGNCGVCGKSSHPVGFADARLDFEWYGTFYLCGDCVGDYARAFGFIDETQYQHLLDNICDLAEKLDWYKAQYEKLGSILGEQYNSASVNPIAHRSDNSDSVNVPTQSEPQESERVVVAFEPKANRGKQQVSEPVVEQESDGVSGATGDDGSTDPLGL